MRIRPASSVLDSASFDAIADMAYRECGLTLVREKATMVQSRLRHRLRALGLQNFAQYTALVHSDEGTAERRQLVCALTTNVSHFFRETHHFDKMCDLVGARMQDLREGGRLRIWSAGCSNGQEPLSAAIALIERFPEVLTVDLRILATDIDNQVIQFAREGCYKHRQLAGLSEDLRKRHFSLSLDAGQEAQYRIKPATLSLIRYRELNLLGPWPMKHPFDIIFCRNVVIYFDQPTQENLWPRFHNALAKNGALFLGHSERITKQPIHKFTIAGPTTYRREIAHG